MNKFESMLENYAKLATHIGVNVQEGQTLVISSPVECAEFTRMLVKSAYEKGAKDVVVQWNDEICGKIKYEHSPLEVFENFPDWMKESRLSYAKEGACFLSISASDPELLKNIDPAKIAAFRKSSSTALKEFSEMLMSNKNAWSIVSIPTKAWAKKVFSDLPEEEAVDKLWNEIFKIVRVDTENPVEAWNKHKETLKYHMDYLNEKNLKSLHFEN